MTTKDEQGTEKELCCVCHRDLKGWSTHPVQMEGIDMGKECELCHEQLMEWEEDDLFDSEEEWDREEEEG